MAAAQESIEAQQASKEHRNGDKVNLPTNDITCNINKFQIN